MVTADLLHVGAYGFLTLLAAWLPVRRNDFRGVVGLPVLHAITSRTAPAARRTWAYG